jgi:NAD-dependent SIR2 family protein deacetylase
MNDTEAPAIDDTYSQVRIDGVELDAVMVRTLMAQNSLPHIDGRTMSMVCSKCGHPAFDTNERAFTPETGRVCTRCQGKLEGAGRLRKVIANPMVELLTRLGGRAPRQPQRHTLGPQPETL